MYVKKQAQQAEAVFLNDVQDWFLGRQHGHMGKWQYMEAKFAGDPCCGNELWDIWENLSQEGNMLNRQKQIIKDNASAMAELTGPVNMIVDLGPGGEHAVLSNTIPFINAYKNSLRSYTAIDMNPDFAVWASEQVSRNNPSLITKAINKDFYGSEISIPKNEPAIVLFNGGTIGNFQAEQNTSKSIDLMAAQIQKSKRNMPYGSFMFVGLEATQDPALLYGDYDHPAHAAYEINVMYGIKRDLIPDEDGFDPSAWKYSMAWWPAAYQFCHIAEGTQDQTFVLNGIKFNFSKGKQLVVDNSFKFPILAMQKAAQIAGTEYLKPFADSDGRMIIHAIKL